MIHEVIKTAVYKLQTKVVVVTCNVQSTDESLIPLFPTSVIIETDVRNESEGEDHVWS